MAEQGRPQAAGLNIRIASLAIGFMIGGTLYCVFSKQDYRTAVEHVYFQMVGLLAVWLSFNFAPLQDYEQ